MHKKLLGAAAIVGIEAPDLYIRQVSRLLSSSICDLCTTYDLLLNAVAAEGLGHHPVHTCC